MSDGNGGTDVATVTVQVAPYAGPGASGLLQINESVRVQRERVDEIRAQITAVTAEIEELREQDPPNNALIQQKIIEQQNLLQQYNNAIEVYSNSLARLFLLRNQILGNI